MLTSETVALHRVLNQDEDRMMAYRAAIQHAVRPGDVVLDVGTGSGVLALFACQAGAARVYAIEFGMIASLAEQLAEANGFDDRITFIKSDVRSAAVPQPVDVITSELISRGGVGQRAEELISTVRDRYLKPGGRIVPGRVQMFAAPVEAPAVYEELLFPPQDRYGLDFSIATGVSLCQPASTRIQPAQLLGAPASLLEIDYYQVQPDFEYRSVVELVTSRPGTLHGCVVWFDAELVPEVHLSNVPPGSKSWTNAFFPLPEPLTLEAGARITFDWRGVHPPGGGTHWTWKTTCHSPSGLAVPSRRIAAFQQTSLPWSSRS